MQISAEASENKKICWKKKTRPQSLSQELLKNDQYLSLIPELIQAQQEVNHSSSEAATNLQLFTVQMTEVMYNNDKGR